MMRLEIRWPALLFSIGAVIVVGCADDGAMGDSSSHLESDVDTDSEGQPDSSPDDDTDTEDQSQPEGTSSPLTTGYVWSAGPLINNHAYPTNYFGFGYPAITKQSGSSIYIMLRGGLVEEACAGSFQGAPCPPPIPKNEGIYISTSLDGIVWSDPVYSFQIMPDTPVHKPDGAPTGLVYDQTYPGAFKYECAALPNNYCHVQINDPTAVVIDGVYYVYFSILENYRFYDPIALDHKDQGDIGGTVPHARKYTHSIGLATTTNFANWMFRGKVIPENTTQKLIDGQMRDTGAWAPGAIKTGDDVLVFYHDAQGTRQFVSTLTGGTQLASTHQLNANENPLVYRVNVDVVYSTAEDQYQMAFDGVNAWGKLDIRLMRFNTDFSGYGEREEVVWSIADKSYVTPHQFVTDDGYMRLYFNTSESRPGQPNEFHHWFAAQSESFAVDPL